MARNEYSAGEYTFDAAALKSWQQRAMGGNGRQREHLKKCLPLVLDDMTPRQREVFCLHYGRGLTPSQVARQLGVHRSTVSRTLKAAERKIRRTLRYLT